MGSASRWVKIDDRSLEFVKKLHGSVPQCLRRMRPGKDSGFCRNEVTHIRWVMDRAVEVACADHAKTPKGST